MGYIGFRRNSRKLQHHSFTKIDAERLRFGLASTAAKKGPWSLAFRFRWLFLALGFYPKPPQGHDHAHRARKHRYPRVNYVHEKQDAKDGGDDQARKPDSKFAERPISITEQWKLYQKFTPVFNGH
jgi:hypothetical protein